MHITTLSSWRRVFQAENRVKFSFTLLFAQKKHLTEQLLERQKMERLSEGKYLHE